MTDKFDPVSDERLRELSQGATIYGHERNAIAAELIAARAELRRMSEWHDEIADTVPCDVAGPHYGIVEWHQMVLAERDAARAEVATVDAAISDRGVSERDCGLPLAKRVDNLILDLKQCRFDLAAAEMENTKLRAQLHADDQRAWEAIGKPEGTHDTTNVQRLCAEVERLRSRVGWLDHLDTAEGRAMHATEAVRVENEQLRANLREAMELLAKHKETP